MLDTKALQRIRDNVLGVPTSEYSDLNSTVYLEQIRDALLGISPARIGGNLHEKIYLQQIRNAKLGVADSQFGSLPSEIYLQQIINAFNGVADGVFGDLSATDYLNLMETVAGPVALIVNGGFDVDTHGWSAGNATLASVPGGNTGNCLRITNTAVATGRASQKISVPNGTYTLSIYQNNGTATGYVSTSTAPGLFDGEISSVVALGAWHLATFTLHVTADLWLNLWVNDTPIGRTVFYDDVSLVKV